MAPVRPNLQRGAKAVVSAAFCLIGAVAGMGLYFADLAYVGPQPKATIVSPINGSSGVAGKFGAIGTALHIPSTSQLWLVDLVTAQDLYYPVEAVTPTGGTWSVSPSLLCLAPGIQKIGIYIVPDSEAASLSQYVSAKQNAGINPGIQNVPPGTALLAASTVTVTASKAAAPAAPTWSAHEAYTSGDEVSYKRDDWTANQWNYDEVPGGVSGAWTIDSECR
jgi:hypothetical protein